MIGPDEVICTWLSKEVEREKKLSSGSTVDGRASVDTVLWESPQMEME